MYYDSHIKLRQVIAPFSVHAVSSRACSKRYAVDATDQLKGVKRLISEADLDTAYDCVGIYKYPMVAVAEPASMKGRT